MRVVIRNQSPTNHLVVVTVGVDGVQRWFEKGYTTKFKEWQNTQKVGWNTQYKIEKELN